MSAKKKEVRYEGVYVSVFNCHNEDEQKAKQIFALRFGIKAFNFKIQPHIRNGVMGIFQVKPNKYLLYYANTLAELSCDRHGWTLIPAFTEDVTEKIKASL